MGGRVRPALLFNGDEILATQKLKKSCQRMLEEELTSEGWSKEGCVFYRQPSKEFLLAATFVSTSGNRWVGGLDSIYYLPALVFIDIGIEREYKRFQKAIKPWCPLSTGTIVITAPYFRVGCPRLFLTPFPEPALGYPQDVPWPSIDTSNWEAFCATNSAPCIVKGEDWIAELKEAFQFHPGLANLAKACEMNSEKLDATQVRAQIRCMTEEIEQIGHWLIKQTPNRSALIDLVVRAAYDFNLCILFGPDFNFRIPFILLSEGRFEEAKYLKEMFDTMRLSDMLGLHASVVDEKYAAMEAWIKKETPARKYNSLTEETAHVEQDCVEIVRTIPPLVTYPYFKFEGSPGDLPSRAIPFYNALPGSVCCNDPELIARKRFG